MISKLDKLIEYALYILILFLPVSKSIAEVCAITAIVAWILKKILICKDNGVKAIKLISTPINMSIYLFIFISFLSIFWSTYPEISVSAFIRKWLEYIALFFVVVEAIDEKKKVRRLIFLMAISAIVVGVDGFVQLFTGTDVLRGYSIVSTPRMQACFKFPAGFSSWLSIIIFPFLSLSLFYKENRKLKILFSMIAIMLFLCLVLSFSKGALIAGFLGLLLLFSVKRKNKKSLLLPIVIFLVVLLLFVFFSPTHLKQSLSPFSESVRDRIYMWKTGLNMIIDRPLLGQGLNTFMANYEKFTPQEGRVYGSGISYAHNCFIQIAAEIGIFGLCAFLWMIGATIKDSVNIQRIIKDNFLSSVHLGFFCGVITFLIYSAFETTLYSFRLAILFWYSLGVLMAISKIGAKNVT